MFLIIVCDRVYWSLKEQIESRRMSNEKKNGFRNDYNVEKFGAKSSVVVKLKYMKSNLKLRLRLRPYHAEYTGSRPITEVKQRRA